MNIHMPKLLELVNSVKTVPKLNKGKEMNKEIVIVSCVHALAGCIVIRLCVKFLFLLII